MELPEPGWYARYVRVRVKILRIRLTPGFWILTYSLQKIMD
jgi:hypothetical protein